MAFLTTKSPFRKSILEQDAWAPPLHLIKNFCETHLNEGKDEDALEFYVRDHFLNSCDSLRNPSAIRFSKCMVLKRNRSFVTYMPMEPDHDEGIKFFLGEYEEYQRDHRTTLTQALTNFLTAQEEENFVVTFEAEVGRISNPVGGHVPSVESHFRKFPKQTKNAKNGLAIYVKIDEAFSERFLLNKDAEDWLSEMRMSTMERVAPKRPIPRDSLKAGLQHAHASFAFNGGSEKIEKFGKDLLLHNQRVHRDGQAVTREAIRLIQGILLNLKYVAADFSDRLQIVLIRDGELTTFFSCFSNQDVFPNRELAVAVHELHSCVTNVRVGGETIKTDEAAAKEAFSEQAFKNLVATLPLDNGTLWNAITATIRFANVYRPIAVHEGTEQQLSFIIGFEHELKTYLSQEIDLSGQKLMIPDVRKWETPLPVEVIRARSQLKAFSNVLSTPDYAVFVDMDNGGSPLRDGGYRLPAVYRFTADNYKYPGARSFMDIDREENMAIVKIHGRTRVDLIYRGEPVASWSDHVAAWGVDRHWDEKQLVECICKRICSGYRTCRHRRASGSCYAACYAAGCGGGDALRTVVGAVMHIARTPQQGAAVVLCCDKTFDLTEGNYGRTGLTGRLANMAEGDVHALNCIEDITKMQDEDLLIHMLTLDGGSVFNMVSRKFWCRRTFVGPRNFNLDAKFPAPEQGRLKITLEALWADKEKGDLYWENWSRIKEWGTRHQNSLALSGCCLLLPNGSLNVTYSRDTGYRGKTVRFVVLVASADGSVTLMHNGRVVPPPPCDQAGGGVK